MAKKTGIERALEKFQGSPTKMAAAFPPEAKIIRQHIEHWLKSGVVPMEKCAVVAQVTGVPLGFLNDQVDWSNLREVMGAA